MQVYRGMNIGTEKPDAGERAELPHHLIDIFNPDEQFSAGDFVRLAGEAAEDIAKRGKLPVVSGGTGFYLKNFIMGLPEAPPSDAAIRNRLKIELKEKGPGMLMDELAAIDPESAGRIHINDEYRLLRALEVTRLSGRPLSSFNVSGAQAVKKDNFRAGEDFPRFRFYVYGLFRKRDELYRRINERCAVMFSQGLPGEVRSLYDVGYTPMDPGLKAIGYREFFVEDEPGVFRLSTDMEGVQALISQNSRRYAKRQVTFFSSLPGTKQIEACGDEETAVRLFEELELIMG